MTEYDIYTMSYILLQREYRGFLLFCRQNRQVDLFTIMCILIDILIIEEYECFIRGFSITTDRSFSLVSIQKASSYM